MNLKESAIDLVAEYFKLFPPYLGEDQEEYNTYTTGRYMSAKICAMKQIKAIIKFGNEMGVREPMMKYNKILEELKKL